MDVREILGEFGIELEQQRPRKDGEEISALCPFHDDTQPSFSLNVEKGVYICFACGAKGTVWDIVAEYTSLSAQEAREAFEDGLPRFAHTRKIRKKKPEKNRDKYLSDTEIKMLTSYAMGYHVLLTDGAIEWQRYLIQERGLSWDAIYHFKLGANDIDDYNGHFMKTQADNFHVYGPLWDEFLKNTRLINAGGGDYYWNPAVILPYAYDGRVYYMNARILPGHDDRIKYQGMSGIVREVFFNEDALDHYDSLYVVEGEFNAIAMWDAGFKNVVSFGGKNQLSRNLISRLYGKDAILYFDTDRADPEFKQRTEAVQRLLAAARSVAYFELPQGIDPNDYLKTHSRTEFQNNILAHIVSVPPEEDFSPGEYRVIPESQRQTVISLPEAQEITSRFMQNVAENFPAYSGKRILVNMPVGTGKSKGAVDLINSRRHDKALVLAPTHYNAADYDDMLAFDTFSLHLKGRAHADMECEYASKANSYASMGYSLLFRLRYCCGICGQAGTLEQGKRRARREDDPIYADVGCLYLRQLEAARTAMVLIGTHAHGHLRDFLINPYYGNDRRNLTVIDEEADLVRNVYLPKAVICHNIDLFAKAAQHLTKTTTSRDAADAAVDLTHVLSDMEKARLDRKGYRPDLKPVNGKATYELDRAICQKIMGNGSALKPCVLHDLVYAINNGLPFEYDNDRDSLYYTWRPVFPDRACVIFLSATTPKAYLENALGMQLDEVVGEQYHVRRDKLQIVQLLNVTGGRTRLLADTKLKAHIKDFLRLALERHKGQRIMIITSQGAGISRDEDGTAKSRIIDMLQPIAQAAGRCLVPIGTSDLEAGNVPGLASDIPVIHYGIQGTNVFADYDVLIELNAHYYHKEAIIDGVRVAFGLDISDSKPVKKEVPFRTWDREYTVERYVHEDSKVGLYIQANQEADVQQTEGRILRGKDTPKVIYRLHNVNIRPYADRVYKSWGSLFKAEFGHTEITGKMADVLGWIQDNVQVGEEFTTRQVCEAIGGYVWEINKRYMCNLARLGYIHNTAQGRGVETKWKRIV